MEMEEKEQPSGNGRSAFRTQQNAKEDNNPNRNTLMKGN
jgi:hypothetical protein